MNPLKVMLALALGAALSGCVMPYHEENAALRMARPIAQPRELADYTAPNTDYPTVGGNILKNQNADFQAAPEQPVH